MVRGHRGHLLSGQHQAAVQQARAVPQRLHSPHFGDLMVEHGAGEHGSTRYCCSTDSLVARGVHFPGVPFAALAPGPGPSSARSRVWLPQLAEQLKHVWQQ